MASAIDIIKNGLDNITERVSSLITDLSVTEKALGAAALGAVVGGVATGIVVSAIKKRKRKNGRKRRRKKEKRRRRKVKRKHRVRHVHRVSPRGKAKRHKTGRAHHAGGTKAIHYTKKGQPYIILRSGKARFITKRGAKMSRRRKGGRY